MSLSALLTYTGVALALVAFIFFLIGCARYDWRIAPPVNKTRHVDRTELARIRALQRADWTCAVLLIVVALVAYISPLFGAGPYFNEPSGNIAGGVLLIAGIVSLATIIALLVRHLTVSRALRKLD